MNSSGQKQKGLVLVFTLIIVLVLTLTVVAGLRDSVNTQKMISSANSYQLAFERAEAATHKVYEIIDNLTDPNKPFDDGDTGYFKLGDAPDDLFNNDEDDDDYWPDNSVAIDDARYMIEKMNSVSPQGIVNLAPEDYDDFDIIQQAHVYRVVVQATDDSGKSRQAIETFYAKVFE